MSSDEAFILEVLAALRDSGMEGVVVGSVAALLQGAPLTTDDMDVLIRDTPANRNKLKELEQRLGGKAVALSPLSSALRITTRHANLDILFDEIPGGLGFQGLRARSARIDLGDVVAVVASLEDIIASKEAAGRPKDIAQLPILKDTLQVIRALKRP
jgi:predicted nucleotidyltransferase